MSNSKEIIKKEENQVEKARRIRRAIPSVDIYENSDEIMVHADMPGVGKKDVSVNIDNGKLTISGIRHTHSHGEMSWEEFTDIEYVRTFSVPQSIDIERVEAELKDGVLKLHLPKSEAAKPRTIEIKAA